MPAPELPTQTEKELHIVNMWSRVALGMIAAFAGWQMGWIYEARSNVEAVIPNWQGTDVWLWLWLAVGITSAAGALTGRDMLARLGFGTTAVVSAMGAATIFSAGRSTDIIQYTMTGQFYAFGQAVLLSALSFDMLLSPLRTIPSQMTVHNFRKVLGDGRN